MKPSIKFLAIIALFFTFSFAANAQRGGGQQLAPEDRAEKETIRMVEKLSLDQTQATKIKEINLTYAKKMQVAHEDNKENREAMKEIGAAIDTEKSAELKQVLTQSQFTAYEGMKSKNGKGKGKGKKGSRQGKK